MDQIVIRGGRPLCGEVAVSGSKNAALPLLVASLLADGDVRLGNVPSLADIRTTLRLLSALGVGVAGPEEGEIRLRPAEPGALEAPYDLVKTMRASFLVLGPLLTRYGRARVSTPGGCAIGARPVNLHLAGLERMGATIGIEHGYVTAEAPPDGRGGRRLRGARIDLGTPSVGATENLMMAASLARGTSRIGNAACEPEIGDLGELLAKMGARVSGAGSPVIEIEGVSHLGAASHSVIPDRIEAGTFLVAAAMTGGDCLVRGARAAHLGAFLENLQEMGVDLHEEPGAVRARAGKALSSVSIRTAPYPGFPTDLQAQMMAALAIAEGTGMVVETIFENRFQHALELVRLGADITLEGRSAVVRGVRRLSGAPVMATDLRASVSLVLAGLAAENTTEIRRVYHLDRGYERIEEKLSALGADVERVKGAPG